MPVESAYVMSLEETSWGLILIAVTMLVHGVGTTSAILATESPDNPALTDRIFPDFLRVIALVLLLVIVHLVEVVIWAGFFYWKDCFPTMSLSYYVALLDYTTLGTEYDLPSRWRILEGMIAICGLLTFAWTTSILMGVIQQIQARRVDRRHRLRAAAAAARPGAKHPPPAGSGV